MKKILVSLGLVILCMASCGKPNRTASNTRSTTTRSTTNTQEVNICEKTLSGIPVERIRPKKIYSVEDGGDLYNIILVEINGKEICYFDGYRAGGPVYIGD